MYVLNDKKAPPALLMLRFIKIRKQDHSKGPVQHQAFAPCSKAMGVGRAFAEDCLNRVSNICSKTSTSSYSKVRSTTRQTCSGAGHQELALKFEKGISPGKNVQSNYQFRRQAFLSLSLSLSFCLLLKT